MILSMDKITIDQNDQIVRTGIILAMASVIMLFGTLLSSFFVLKIRLMEKLVLPGNTFSIGLTNSVILVCTSISYMFAEKMYEKRKYSAYEIWLLITIISGYGFILGQLLLWSELTTAGIPLTRGQLSDMFYVISGVHGLHILCGQGLLLWVQLSKNNNGRRIHNVGLFWHFLTILWIIMFTTVLV